MINGSFRPFLALVVLGRQVRRWSADADAGSARLYRPGDDATPLRPMRSSWAVRTIAIEQLGQDLQTVASWVLHPGKENARTIQIQMEAYSGAPDQWEGQFESQTHGNQEGTLIHNKTPMTLLNGMPAYFVEVAYGSGFDARKEYAIVWADGQRGIVLSETSRRWRRQVRRKREEVLKQATASAIPVAISRSFERLRKIVEKIARYLRSLPKDARARRSMPRCSRISLGMDPWVMRAGWQMSDSTPPKLSARLKYCSRAAKSSARCGGPTSSKESIPPKPLI